MQKRPSSMPINIQRPKSALLRGVHITEFKDHVINPDPIILQETDLLLEEFLSPTKLKALTGVDDLISVEKLEMVVDTSETSLGNFGIYLPNLKQLKLSSSYVPRIRDLGTSLIHLRVLWLSRSGVTDLDGIPALSNLEELYLAYNEITDISPCSMLENLKILDLEGNLIDDLRQVEFLSLCSSLNNLTLMGNPVCTKPNSDAKESKKYNYRNEVISVLLNIRILDDEVVVRDSKNSTRSSYLKENVSREQKEEIDAAESPRIECPFEDDWQLINQCLEEGVGPSEEKLAINEAKRPGTASTQNGSPLPNLRPLSAMRPLYSARPGSALRRPGSSSNSRVSTGSLATPNNRPQTNNRPQSDPINDITNDASELTIGPALQGNPLKGLLSRRKKPEKKEMYDQKHINLSTNQTRKHSSVKKGSENEAKQNRDSEFYQELKNFKKEQERKMEERKKYFEPNILKIDDNVDPVISDQDDDVNEDDDAPYDFGNTTGHRYTGDGAIYIESSSNEKSSKNSSKYEPTIKSQTQRRQTNIEQDYNYRSPSAASNTSSLLQEDESNSRAATGDTGYGSNSDSISNLSSIKSPKIEPLKPNISTSLHQPVIKLSNAQSASKPAALKQLKPNLLPISNIKFAKN